MEQNNNQPRTLAQVAQRPNEMAVADLKIDMFSLRGFELAQRIAKAFATSDAVPAQFRAFNLKKTGNEEHWVENQSALGNCLVAVETAQAVGMSITAVMQNANIIEGKLSWSGKFVIAAVNASGRFTPLRFHIVNRGMIKAKYKEKTGWDNQARRPIFTDREVELENIECTAWALPAGMPFPPGVATLDQAKAAGLPVIEGAPVSMEMAVQEGWYSKPGSKWQTGMKHLMLQYRAGAYFGNIHAPDVVMGMGRTTEELVDSSEFIDLNPPPAKAQPVDLVQLAEQQVEVAKTVRQRAQAQPEQPAESANSGTVEQAQASDAGTETGKADQALQLTPEIQQAYESLAAQIARAHTLDALAEAADLIKTVEHSELRAQLNTMYRQRYEEFLPREEAPAEEAKKEPRARRSRGAATGNIE